MNRPSYNLPCQTCGSSDALTDYGTHTHCFSCGEHLEKTEHISEQQFPSKETEEVKPSLSLAQIDKTKFKALTNRGVSQKTAEFYKVWTNDRDEYVFPFFDLEGRQHVANQFRTINSKGFMVQGSWSKSGLFGQQLFPAGSAKQITLLEGAVDALSAFEMTGSQWPCVAVKSASSARKEVADNFEYLNAFDKIVVCFDKDEEHKHPDGSVTFPGQEAAEKVASMFPLGKVRLMILRKAKDANDYLKAGWSADFQKEWWGAREWTPVGLQHAKDCWEDVLAAKTTKYKAVPYPWDGLNALTYGIRTSELVTITANPKVGKTSILREISHNILQKILNETNQQRVGVMYLEEPKKDTLMGLMSLTANKPLHLPDVLENTSEEELKKYFDEVYKHDKIILWNHFGSNDIVTVLSYIRYMANLGCKYVILDHLSIVVSDQSGDERKQLDEITTKIKTLTIELDIAVIVVIHQNRAGQIRGTAGVEQLSNMVIKLYRDMLSDDEEIRNTMKVSVEMNRFSGKTGPACLLRYDGETGRLQELPEEALKEHLILTATTKKKSLEEW